MPPLHRAWVRGRTVMLAAGGAVRNTSKKKRLVKIEEKFEREDYRLEEYIDGISKWTGFSM